MGISAAQAIGTGFEGVFSRRSLTPAQKERVWELLRFCQDHLRPARSGDKATLEEIGSADFAHFTPAQQALLLFLRALIGRPRLLILDEPSQGVDEAMWECCVRLLKQEWKARPEMATVVVSHYEDEVPWGKEEGRVMRLNDGIGAIG